MERVRKVKRTVTGNRTVDGAGVNLVRVLGKPDVLDFDPFLMLDAFDSTDPADYTKGFPWHPHRGIETITYLVQGDIEHADSLGNSGSIKDGDCQWMTAGSGIIHQEMPKASKRMLGAQLWLNLPAKDKMTHPAYNDITKDMVPIVESDGVRVHVISGSYKGVNGAFEGKFVKPTYLDMEMEPGAKWEVLTNTGDTVFLYIFEGSLEPSPGEETVPEKRAVLFTDGEKVALKAGNAGARLLVMQGRPLGEPISWGGPIVMNTKDELRLAFRELDEDTFIKHGAKVR